MHDTKETCSARLPRRRGPEQPCGRGRTGADATGETAYIIAGPVPMPIKPRGARWTPLFQPCRCRVLARRVLWNWRTLKVHNGELYMCNYRLAARTTCHCVRPCCIWACTASSSYLLACAISGYRGIQLFVRESGKCVSTELPLQPAVEGWGLRCRWGRGVPFQFHASIVLRL